MLLVSRHIPILLLGTCTYLVSRLREGNTNRHIKRRNDNSSEKTTATTIETVCACVSSERTAIVLACAASSPSAPSSDPTFRYAVTTGLVYFVLRNQVPSSVLCTYVA